MALALLSGAFGCRPQPPARVLRVCADPNNLPFSNEAGQGFENELAGLLGEELGAKVEYTWWAQRRGFIRNTLKARLCDVVMGLPQGVDMALTTRPYYRSTYVFAYRGDRPLDLRTFDDPALRTLKVGVQIIGDDYANSPPAHALARRGIVQNVVGFSVLGDYSQKDPPARILDALERGDIDVAAVWGPLAGYFARQHPGLKLVPVSPERDAGLPFVFDISLGVRKGDAALKQELEAALDRRRADVDRILDTYGVPRV